MRRISTAIRVTSLLLATFTVAIWIRSSFRADQIRLNHSNSCWQISTEKNQFSIEHINQRDEKFPNGWSYRKLPYPDRSFDFPQNTATHFKILGFGMYTLDYPKASLYFTALVIPFWFLVSLFLLPIVKYVIDRRYRNATVATSIRRRPAIRLLNLTTIISLILCVLAIDLWQRSHEVSDNINLRWASGVATIGTIDDGFTLVIATRRQPKVPNRGFLIGTLPFAEIRDIRDGAKSSDANTYFELAGFAIWHYHHRSNASPTRFLLIVPCWFALMLLLIAPGARFKVWLRDRARRRRLKAGLCWRCGYSLTGNLSGTCPECGAPASGPDVVYEQSIGPNASAYSSGSAGK